MVLDEVIITEAIIEKYFKKVKCNLKVDVGIVGAGPSGLVAAYFLAKNGIKTVIFEKRLSPGGGIWGGGMMFNEIVVQDKAKEILDLFGVRTEKFQEGYYTADAIEVASTIISHVIKSGVTIFNLFEVEDVVVEGERISGVVVNWTPVNIGRFHIDPLCFRTRYLVDATGHEAKLIKILKEKLRVKLFTETGDILGERSLWADKGESVILENTKEVYPQVFVAGMAANVVCGGFRMGPIFGGMLLSGRKVANLIYERISKSRGEKE